MLAPYPRRLQLRAAGLAAPLMQFAGSAADTLYVHVTFSNFSYEGFYAPAEPSPEEMTAGIGSDKSKWPLRASLSDSVWHAIENSTKGTEDITVSVTKLAGDQVSGPVTRHWRIADGELQGMVYYNTYNSGLPDVGCAIIRVPLGGNFEPVMGVHGCTVCHSISANGKVLAAATGYSEESAGKNSGNPVESASYDLSEMGGAGDLRSRFMCTAAASIVPVEAEGWTSYFGHRGEQLDVVVCNQDARLRERRHARLSCRECATASAVATSRFPSATATGPSAPWRFNS